MSRPTRRAFLKGASGSLVTAALAATNAQLAQAADRSVYTRGTTLEQAAAPVATGGYTRLTAGPGYPLVVRADLAEPRDGTTDHGQQLAVGEGHLAVVDGRGIRVCTRGGGEHVAEGARRVCLCRQEELRWNGHLSGTCRAHPRSGHESENIADEGDRTTSTP